MPAARQKSRRHARRSRTRCSPRAKTAGSGNRLTTRKPRARKSKKKPGWTTTPSRSSSSMTSSSSRAGRRHAQHRRPARRRRAGPRSRIRGRHVARSARSLRADALEDRGAHALRRQREQRRRHLDRRRDRQVGVADQLEAIERLGARAARAVDDDPAKLHLRKAGRLRQAAQPERQALAADADGELRAPDSG